MTVGEGKRNQQVKNLSLILNSTGVYDLSKGNSLVLLTTGYNLLLYLFRYLLALYRSVPLLEPGFAPHMHAWDPHSSVVPSPAQGCGRTEACPRPSGDTAPHEVGILCLRMGRIHRGRTPWHWPEAAGMRACP